MKRRIIIAIVAFLVLVGGGSLSLWLVSRSPSLQNAIYKATNTNQATNSASNINVARPATTPDREATIFVARNFSETYGSFSNQNGGSNLVDAKAYATDNYAAVLQVQANAAQAAPRPGVYSGTITQALVFTNITLGLSAAQIVVTTQQKVTTGNDTKTQTRDLLVDLLKVDGQWKVNAAVWK